MKNLLIGAVSSNYTPSDIKVWVKSSKQFDCERVLLVYNSQNEDLIKFLREENVSVIKPNFGFWGNDVNTFNTNTGICNVDTSYDLIHNIRFLHIWNYLQSNEYDNVLITDVKDVCFNSNPFDKFTENYITATSEEIRYEDEDWNKTHIHYNLGIIGLSTLLDKNVYNVGVVGGSYKLVKELCADIYLLAVGRHKVADQTSFNYLIQTKYKDDVKFVGLDDKVAVHLQVIVNGLVKFNMDTLSEYAIVHQYDRIPSLKSIIEAKYE